MQSSRQPLLGKLCIVRAKLILNENQTLSRLFGPTQYFKCRRRFEELNCSGFYSSSKRGRKIRRRMSTYSIKRQIKRFRVAVVQWTSKKCIKKRDARAELLF